MLLKKEKSNETKYVQKTRISLSPKQKNERKTSDVVLSVVKAGLEPAALTLSVSRSTN